MLTHSLHAQLPPEEQDWGQRRVDKLKAAATIPTWSSHDVGTAGRGTKRTMLLLQCPLGALLIVFVVMRQRIFLLGLPVSQEMESPSSKKALSISDTSCKVGTSGSHCGQLTLLGVEACAPRRRMTTKTCPRQSRLSSISSARRSSSRCARTERHVAQQNTRT